MGPRAGRGSRRGKSRGEAGRSRAGHGAAKSAELATPLRSYYGGEPVPCPIGCGGSAQVVRRATTDDDGGELWFECESCAQRVRQEVPAPTHAERRTVLEAVAASQAPACPRHTAQVALERQGRRLACPECGIVFRE